MSLNNKYIRMDHQPDEDQIWKSFLNGDVNSWEQIFKLFYKDLYGYGLKLSACPELTKDCIHELFVVLWDRKDHLDEVVSMKGYLLASLRRSLLKKMQKKRKYYSDIENKKNRGGIQFSPEELVISDETKTNKLKALYDALESLPDRQKEVLYLKYFNGMSYDEIEDILSINYQSIRNHIYRALQKLRKEFDGSISEVAFLLLVFLLFFAV